MEKTDAALRINRGRIYNEVSDLLYAMNARLASNKIAAPKLVTLTSDFEEKLTTFRNNYNEYDDELNELVSMKCQDKPADFYKSLGKVRDSRTTLNNNIRDLDKIMADYRTEFSNSTRILIDAR